MTGPPAINHDIAPVLAGDLHRGELLALGLALLLLLAVLGPCWALVVPFLVAAGTIGGAIGLVYLLAHHFLMVLYIPNVIELIGLGLAIDYSLLIVHRFRGEVSRSSVDVRRSDRHDDGNRRTHDRAVGSDGRDRTGHPVARASALCALARRGRSRRTARRARRRTDPAAGAAVVARARGRRAGRDSRTARRARRPRRDLGEDRARRAPFDLASYSRRHWPYWPWAPRRCSGCSRRPAR